MAPHYIGWKKSSHSAPNGECVEAARSLSGTVGIRDSKEPAPAAVLELTKAEWAGLLHAARTCPWRALQPR